MSEILKCLGLSLGLSIVGAGVFALLRRNLRHGLSESEQSLVGSGASFAATFFAFLLGFVIVGLWGTYSSAEKLVREETNELRTLDRLAANMRPGQKLQDLIRDYADSVATDEWPAMMQGKFSPRSDELKNSIWNETLSLIQSDKNSPLLGKEALDSLVRMNNARRERLSMLTSSVHPLLLVGLTVTGLSTLVGRFFLGIRRPRIQFLVDFLVLFCITVAMYLVVAVDEPFSGTGFTVSDKHFTALANQITTELPSAPGAKPSLPSCP
jgi:hypothetical protein